MSNPLNGTWYSSAGSKLELIVDRTVLTGRFDSTQDPNGYLPLFGVVAESTTEPNYLPLSFSVSWPPGDGFGPSVTSYTGQYSNQNGDEKIEVVFLLIDQVKSTTLWKASHIATDVFTREPH
jgi:hypothetical protein